MLVELCHLKYFIFRVMADRNHDDSWLPGLADFLRKQEGAEAILFDADSQKISVATLGPIDTKELERNLAATLKAIESSLVNGGDNGAVPSSYKISRVGGKTLLELPSCYTAPKLWQWRDMPWPTEAKAAEDYEHGEHEWQFLAILAGLCGIFGAAGFFAHTFSLGPDWLSIVFFMLAIVAGAWEPVQDVSHNIRKGKLDIHFLMLAVAVGASLIGAWQEGALLLFLFSFSEALEHFALYRTRRGIDALFKSAPREALILEDDGSERNIPVEAVEPGQRMRVKPGDAFPVDAEVVEGESASDESNITGEAAPVEKRVGDEVYSGTINLWGALVVKALRPAQESSLQKIIRLIQDAQHLKAPSQRFTERFGTHYTYWILAVTTGMFFVWWLGFGVPPFKNVGGEYSSFYRAMTLLVVASPCALVLSIPSAFLASIAWGAQRGILFRGGAAIEKLSEVNVVALDKTGTLTTGELSVEKVESFPPGHEEAVLAYAYSLEKNANHPLARAIVQHGKKEGVEEREVDGFRSITGSGVQGNVDDGLCVIGRRELLAEGPLKKWAEDLPDLPEAYTEVWVVYKDLLGRLLLRDQIREESKPVLERLGGLGIRTVMLTGDRREAAESVGKSLGLREVRAGLKPEDKVAAVQAFTEEGKKVAMVGDGVNDAPCLAAAYVAVAMGGRGTDAALEQSEVVLMNDRIDNFLNAYCLSKRAKRIIRQNLAISLGTIGVMVAAAVFGLVPLTLGVFAHEGSTALVCLNSMRLLIFGKKEV